MINPYLWKKWWNYQPLPTSMFFFLPFHSGKKQSGVMQPHPQAKISSYGNLSKAIVTKTSQEFLLKKAPNQKPNSWIPLRLSGPVVPRRWLVHEILISPQQTLPWQTLVQLDTPHRRFVSRRFPSLESRWKNQVAWSIRCSNLGWDRIR